MQRLPSALTPSLLCREMIVAFRDSPEPSPPASLADGRKGSAEIGAIAVIFGWMARMTRTGEATLMLNSMGYAVEASPMVRSLLEHAIAICWLEDQRGGAFQSLARARSYAMDKFRTAQEHGWAVDDDIAVLLDEAIQLETDAETRTQDSYLHLYEAGWKYGLDPA